MQKPITLEPPSLVPSLRSSGKYCIHQSSKANGISGHFLSLGLLPSFSSFSMALYQTPKIAQVDELSLSYSCPVSMTLLDCLWTQPRTTLCFQYHWPFFLCTSVLRELKIFVACPTVCWPSLLEVPPGHPWSHLILSPCSVLEKYCLNKFFGLFLLCHSDVVHVPKGM